MFKIPKETEIENPVLRILFHLLCGLALLYFMTKFPFPTVDIVYENY